MPVQLFTVPWEMCYREIAVAEKQEDGTVTLQGYVGLVPESEMDH